MLDGVVGRYMKGDVNGECGPATTFRRASRRHAAMSSTGHAVVRNERFVDGRRDDVAYEEHGSDFAFTVIVVLFF